MMCALIVMISCEKPSGDDLAHEPKPDVVEILSPESIEVSPIGEVLQVAFYSSGSWIAKLVRQGTANWCSVTPASGESGEYIVFISAEANNTDEARSAKLVVVSGDASADIDLYQHYSEYITISHDVAEVGPEGGLLEVEVDSNVEISVEIPLDCNWIKYLECVENQNYKFLIEENTGNSVRSVDVIFYGGRSKLSKRIKVIQAKGESYDDGLDSDISIPVYNEDEWI